MVKEILERSNSVISLSQFNECVTGLESMRNKDIICIICYFIALIINLFVLLFYWLISTKIFQKAPKIKKPTGIVCTG